MGVSKKSAVAGVATGVPGQFQKSAANLGRKLPGIGKAESFFSGIDDDGLGLLEEARPPTGDSTDSRLAALRRAETDKKLREARGRKSSFMFGGSETIGNGFKPDNILGSRRS